jgi:hypothetical protein
MPVPKRVDVEMESELDDPRPVMEPERFRPNVAEEVETFASVLGPEKYARLPWTALVEVERPLKAKAPVEELYASGNVAESEVEEILLLKVFQSDEER